MCLVLIKRTCLQAPRAHSEDRHNSVLVLTGRGWRPTRSRGNWYALGISMLCAVPFGMHWASVCYVQFPLVCTVHQYAMCSSLWYALGISLLCAVPFGMHCAVPFGMHRASICYVQFPSSNWPSRCRLIVGILRCPAWRFWFQKSSDHLRSDDANLQSGILLTICKGCSGDAAQRTVRNYTIPSVTLHHAVFNFAAVFNVDHSVRNVAPWCP